jgi:glyoxylase-like metal-dependent hydrolase (beta-lactamase superfamily II)
LTPHPDATTALPQTQRQAWETGGTPDVEQVQPGLWAIPVPIPHNPLRYTLSYALQHEHGLAVVDPGWNAPLSWQTLCAGLEATGHAVESVTAVLATHVHPDHYGLADQLRRHSGAWVGLHPADAALLDTDDDVPRLAAATRAMFTMTGAPELHLDPGDYERALRHFVPAGTPDRLLHDRELIDLGPWQLEVLHTPGHTPGHICLLEGRQRILLTGDHILPRITGNIGLHGETGEQSLAQFLTSLHTLRSVANDVDDVLPAHEYRFTDLDSRIAEIEQHHEHRLRETLHAVHTTPTTAWDIAQRLTWSRPWADIDELMQRLAAAETLAHLVLLLRRGQLTRSRTTPAEWRK